MSKFTAEDFKFDMEEMVSCLNKIDEITDKLCEKASFCREHGFLREAEYLDTRINNRTSVLVDVCNALGKYF